MPGDRAGSVAWDAGRQTRHRRHQGQQGGDVGDLLAGADHIPGLPADLRARQPVRTSAARPAHRIISATPPKGRPRGRAAQRQRQTEGAGRGEARPARTAHRGGQATRPRGRQQHHRREGGDCATAPRPGSGRSGPRSRSGRGASPGRRSAGPAPAPGRRPISADAAVAHDLQAALPGRAAAETVRHIGEPVLVERPGGQRRGRDGERRGQERAQAEAPGRQPAPARPGGPGSGRPAAASAAGW